MHTYKKEVQCDYIQVAKHRSKQEVEQQFGWCSRAGPSRTGQLPKGLKFKTIMTSPGYERTGQTKKGAESPPLLSFSPPRPSCHQLTQKTTICSSREPKTRLKQNFHPLRKSTDLFGCEAAVGKHTRCTTNKKTKKSSISTEKSRTNKEHAGIILC